MVTEPKAGNRRQVGRYLGTIVRSRHHPAQTGKADEDRFLGTLPTLSLTLDTLIALGPRPRRAPPVSPASLSRATVQYPTLP